MRFGLAFSIVLHAALIAIAAVTLIRVVPIPLPAEEIPAEIVDVAEKTNVKAQAPKEEKPEEKPEPEATPPPAPAPKAAPPANNPDEAALEPAEKPDLKEPQPPKPQERPKPATEEKPKEEKFDPDKIQALLNKAKKDQEKQQKSTPAPAASATDEKPRPSVGEGTDNKASIESLLRNSIQRQVAACWSFPSGALQPEGLVVMVDVRLRPDGALAEAPAIVEQGRMAEPYFRAAAEAAVRAINRCQPYELPTEHYDIWKDVRLNFDPREMVGQ
jgi:outer membrane biosynthesis protein TonB